MNFGVQFQISQVGAPLFSGGAVYVYILIVLYPESAVCSCLQQQTGIPSHLFAVIVKICCCIASSWIQQTSLVLDHRESGTAKKY